MGLEYFLKKITSLKIITSSFEAAGWIFFDFGLLPVTELSRALYGLESLFLAHDSSVSGSGPKDADRHHGRQTRF